MKSGLELAKNIGFTLQLCQHICKRDIISSSNTTSFIQDTMKSGMVCIWQMQSVVWGKLENGSLILPDEAQDPLYWLYARIFNENEEIYLSRKNDDVFECRYVKDTKEKEESFEEIYFVDSFSRFWGDEESFSDGFVNLIDKKRKLTLRIPAEPGCGWYGLCTRHYIGSDKSTGICGFTDFRFVSIESAKEE